MLDAQSAWRARVEAAPDAFYRFDMYPAQDTVRVAMATYVGAASPNDVAFVENASHGVNAVLRSLKVPAGMKILYLSCAYQMVKNTLEFLNFFSNEQIMQVGLQNQKQNQKQKFSKEK